MADSVYFFIGKLKFFSRIRFLQKLKSSHFSLKEKIDKNPFTALIISKFIYGTRIASCFYFGFKQTRYNKFVFYDAVAIAIWESIFLTLGFLTGKGISATLYGARTIEKFFLIAFLLLIIYYLIAHILKKKGKKEELMSLLETVRFNKLYFCLRI